MPEYAQVQTCVACDEKTFPEIVRLFRQVLESIHCVSPDVLNWLSQLDWPSWEQGYDSPAWGRGFSCPTQLLQSQTEAFPARPYVFFPPAEDNERRADWVELGILFEAKPLRVTMHEPIWPRPYKVEAGALVGRLLKTFAQAFPQNGVFFTDEVQDGKPGDVVMEGKENLWQFDAAIIPPAFVDRFGPMPEIFEHIGLHEAVGVVAKGCFIVPPWTS